MIRGESKCRICGKCCYYEIPITILDMHYMAMHLDVADRKVFEEYIQDKVSQQSGLFMIRKDDRGACVFLTADNKCEIHEAKPVACGLYICNDLNSSGDIMPWTATCTDESIRSQLWAQSISATVTKAYIKSNGCTWNEANYYKVILSIYDNVVTSDREKIKLSRNGNGVPLSIIYDCSRCTLRGTCAKETPITLDDAKCIRKHLGISWEIFFRKKIDPQPSVSTGGLKLIRGEQCIFFDSGHCAIEEVRPIHCRFTPCPQRASTDETWSSLFLGSGTVEEQYRHQVALAITRQYVAECGTKYDKQVVRKLLGEIVYLSSNHTELEDFCRKISPYRYVDDTLLISKHQERV